jgi:hypothetical protein
MHALHLASITAVLKYRLENGLVECGIPAAIGGDVIVSTQPPDRISTTADERAQLNLFLYQATPQTGLAGSALRRGEGSGVSLAPPLSLELFYLLTAYGAHDYQPEILLGYALQWLHQTPVLGATSIRAALTACAEAGAGRSLPRTLVEPTLQALETFPIEMRLTLQFLSLEEMSKLWSALQARYRPSLIYKVSLAPMKVGEAPCSGEEGIRPEPALAAPTRKILR